MKVNHLINKKKYFLNLLREEWLKIDKFHNCVNFNNLTYHYKGFTADVNFKDCTDAATLFNMIKSSNMKFKSSNVKLKSKLSRIKIESKQSDEQKSEIKNIRILAVQEARPLSFIKVILQ